MSIRIVTAEELRNGVALDDLIEPVSVAFQESSAKLAENGLIVLFPPPERERGDVHVKTGVIHGRSVFLVKISPWFAANVEKGQPQGGFIGVFDSHTGHTLALLDEQHYLSDIRTAAAGALAARSLAPTTFATAAILGSGVQAYWQARALGRERAFRTLLIWARDLNKAETLRVRLAPLLPDSDVRVSTDLERTVRQADVLVTTTSSLDPLVRGEWLRPGQHVTAVGADDPRKCELDAAALERSQVFVDALDAAAANGDVHRAIAEGRYTLAQVSGEIGDVLAGRIPGRRSDSDITVAKLVGIGAQDLAAAETALRIVNAREALRPCQGDQMANGVHMTCR